MTPVGFQDKVAFVWKVADKLRGTFKQHEYGSVMLPLLVLRRMDAVLAPTKQEVLDAAAGMKDIGEGQAALLKKKAGHRLYNTSPLTFAGLLGDDKNLAPVLDKLSALISPMNDKYGADLGEADKVWVDQQWVVVEEDDEMREVALNNDRSQFEIVLEQKVEDLLIDRHDKNGVLFDLFFSNPDFQVSLVRYLVGTYDEFRKESMA